ncbi:MAG: hypothetical protein ABI333_13515 [bacterium]
MRSCFHRSYLSIFGAALCAALLLLASPARAQQPTPGEASDPGVATPRPATTPTPAASPAPYRAPAAPAAPAAAAGNGPKQSGLVFELKMVTATNIYSTLGFTVGLPLLTGRFMVGYRMGKITLGMGFEFFGTTSDQAGQKEVMATVLFQPTMEMVLVQKNPLTLFMSLGFHVGFLSTSGDTVQDDETPAVGFHAGIGMRYFFHPRFAMGMEGGFQGLWYIDDDNDNDTIGAVGFYGALMLLAIW